MKDKKELSQRLRALETVLKSVGREDIYQRIINAKNVREFHAEINNAVKALKSDLTAAEGNPVISGIVESIRHGSGIEFDLTPKNEASAKPFDFSRITMGLLRRVGIEK